MKILTIFFIIIYSVCSVSIFFFSLIQLDLFLSYKKSKTKTKNIILPNFKNLDPIIYIDDTETGIYENDIKISLVCENQVLKEENSIDMICTNEGVYTLWNLLKQDLSLDNIENLTDKVYFPHSHSTHQASVGEDTNARLSFTRRF